MTQVTSKVGNNRGSFPRLAMCPSEAGSESPDRNPAVIYVNGRPTTYEEYAVETATRVQRRVPRPRADALRNRERIVAAAREMFVEFGPEVPFDEIARRAGVGNATVYRNFPDRDALAREVVCSVMDRTSERAESAIAEGATPSRRSATSCTSRRTSGSAPCARCSPRASTRTTRTSSPRATGPRD